MQFSCNQETFAKYLNVVSRIVSSRPGLPILNNVLFECSKGKLIMTVTDLEISLNCWIGAEVKADGKITAPAKQLSEFMNSIPSEKIDVILDKQVLNVNTLNNSAQFNTIPADDYPSVVTIDDQKPNFQLTKDDVVMAVNRVAFAVATDDVKPVMTGIKLDVKDDSVAFVGADGIRLSRQVIKLAKAASDTTEFIVPAKALQELGKIVVDFESENSSNMVSVFLIPDRNQVVFRYNDIDLVSRLIDGQYPPYQQVIPTGHQTKAFVSRGEFQNALKVVNIIARNVLGNKLIIDQNPKENIITMSAALAEVGSNESSFAANIEGEPIKLAISAKFLGDLLSHVSGDEVVIETSSPVSAVVIRIKDDESFLHLIMPMRL